MIFFSFQLESMRRDQSYLWIYTNREDSYLQNSCKQYGSEKSIKYIMNIYIISYTYPRTTHYEINYSTYIKNYTDSFSISFSWRIWTDRISSSGFTPTTIAFAFAVWDNISMLIDALAKIPVIDSRIPG